MHAFTVLANSLIKRLCVLSLPGLQSYSAVKSLTLDVTTPWPNGAGQIIAEAALCSLFAKLLNP